MRRGIVKSSNGNILNRITVLVIACVLSFLAGVAYTKAGMQAAKEYAKQFGGRTVDGGSRYAMAKKKETKA